MSRHHYIKTVTLAYLLLSLVWILCSDALLVAVSNQEWLVRLSSIKGLFFVLASSVAIYLALRSVPAATPLIVALRPASPRRRWSPLLVHCLVATLLVACMLALRVVLPTGSEVGPLMVLYVLPIVLSAAFGGLWPGLLATVLAAAGVDWLAEPHLHSAASAAHDRFQWALLLGNGLAISLLCEQMRASRHALQQQQQLLSAVVAGTTDAIFIKDVQGRYQMVNQAAADFAGKTIGDILGRDDNALFDAESARVLRELDLDVMQQGQVRTHEEHLTMSDGRTMTFLVTKGPVHDSDGRVAGLFGISRDITAQVRAQAELEGSERALREAQTIAGIGHWEWDVATDTHRWSAQIYRLYGRDPALGPAGYPEVAGYFEPDSWAELQAAVEQALRDGIPYEVDAEVVRSDGSHCWITARGEAVCDAAGRTVLLHGTVQDITERKLALLQLARSEERLQRIVDAASDGFWDWNVISGHVYRSPRYYELFGQPASADQGDLGFFLKLMHPDDVTPMLAAMERHLAGETPTLEQDYRIRHPEKGERWIWARGRAVARDASGRATRLVGTVSDITERKQADDHFRMVLNEAGDAVWITDQQGRYEYANEAACRLTGHSLDQLQDMRIPDLIAPTDLPRLPEHLSKLARVPSLRQEWLLARADGSSIAVDLTTAHMHDGRYMAFGRDLSEQRRAAQILREREAQLARVLDGSDQGYWDWNLRSNVFSVSTRFETMLGYEAGEMRLQPENWPRYLHPDDYGPTMEALQRHFEGETPYFQAEFRALTKQGSWCWLLSRGRVVERDEEGKPLTMSGTHTDINERKKHEEAQRSANAVFRSSYEGIMIVGTDRRISQINPAFSRITGYSEAEAIGQSPRMLSSGQHGPQFYETMWQSIQANDFWRGEIWNRRKNGEVYAELLSISVVRDAQGRVQQYIGVFADISQIKAHEAELDRVAHYDALTGLPNRRLLADRLQQSILRSSRSGKSSAIAFLDLDGFKAINDRHGHNTGDALLIGVAEHLKEVLRADDTLARLGGDEFVLILSEVHSPEECTLILERVLQAAAMPVAIDGLTLTVSASIGVSLYPADNADADTLLRHADQAMYLAKEAGKNRFQLFDPESDRKAQTRRKQLEQLAQALVHDQFVLYYQPKVDLLNGDIIGAEALLRWQHPERGVLAPGEFLPQLHGSELEREFGEWVIERSLAQIAYWQSMGLSITVSSNISANHLLQPGFYDYLAQALRRYPALPPQLLELEVLESAAISDMQQAIDILGRCKRLGIRFALDDFGTGYSSLTYLRKLPIDTLKIDQSFVRDMLVDHDDLGIVESVVQLAKVFGREVIAEGVETAEHGAALRALGCRQAQGYGIARPMPAGQFPLWCTQWRKQPRQGWAFTADATEPS
jgi:diguanylate cyclase (GGDEF)-like protein/PAS domain S-box-containing protein